MAGKHKIIVSKEFVHKKLIFKLRMFVLVFTIMTGIIIYDVETDVIGVPLAIFGVALGLIVGFTLGHLSNIFWHPETGKVVTQLDRIGVVILIVYISFSVSKKWLFGHWIHGPALTAFCFSLASGITLGRFLSTRFQVKDILTEQGHLKKN